MYTMSSSDAPFKYTCADVNALLNTFSSCEGAPLKNGYALYVLGKEKNNFSRAARILMELVKKQNCQCNLNNISTKVHSINKKYLHYRKKVSVNWTKIQSLLEETFVLPVSKPIKKATPVTEVVIETGPESEMKARVLKTDCTNCVRLRASFIENAMNLKSRLRHSRKMLTQPKNVSIKQMNQSLKRKNERIKRLRTESIKLRKEIFLLEKKIGCFTSSHK